MVALYVVIMWYLVGLGNQNETHNIQVRESYLLRQAVRYTRYAVAV